MTILQLRYEKETKLTSDGTRLTKIVSKLAEMLRTCSETAREKTHTQKHKYKDSSLIAPKKNIKQQKYQPCK